MSVKKNKALVLRYIAETNNIKGNPDKVRALAQEFYAPNFVAHHSMMGDMNSEQYTAAYEGIFAAFPDMKYTIENIIAEGDKVVVQMISTGTQRASFQGIPPTGKQIEITGVGIYRIEGDKFVENWGFIDSLSMMQQLGVIPSK